LTPQAASASGTISAPAATYSSSLIEDPHPGTGLDEHPMTVRHQLVHPDRRDRHPILVILDFLRYADK